MIRPEQAAPCRRPRSPRHVQIPALVGAHGLIVPTTDRISTPASLLPPTGGRQGCPEVGPDVPRILGPGPRTACRLIAADRGLIDLDRAAQRWKRRGSHRPAQAVKCGPSGLAAGQAKCSTQVERVDARTRRHEVGRPEPGQQRKARSVKDRAGRDRRFVATGPAEEHESSASLPGPVMAACGTAEPVRPAALDEVGPTSHLVRKDSLELGDVGWERSRCHSLSSDRMLVETTGQALRQWRIAAPSTTLPITVFGLQTQPGAAVTPGLAVRRRSRRAPFPFRFAS